jgi:hypothetical protein
VDSSPGFGSVDEPSVVGSLPVDWVPTVIAPVDDSSAVGPVMEVTIPPVSDATLSDSNVVGELDDVDVPSAGPVHWPLNGPESSP